MREATDWLNRYERFWKQRLDQLAAFLEEDECPTPSLNQTLPNQASPSSAASKPLRAKVYAAWTDPEKVKRWMAPRRQQDVWH